MILYSLTTIAQIEHGIITNVAIERVPKKPWIPKTVLQGY